MEKHGIECFILTLKSVTIFFLSTSVAVVFYFFHLWCLQSLLFFLQGFYGTVALVANLSLSLIDSCVMWWISFTQPNLKCFSDLISYCTVQKHYFHVYTQHSPWLVSTFSSASHKRLVSWSCAGMWWSSPYIGISPTHSSFLLLVSWRRLNKTTVLLVWDAFKVTERSDSCFDLNPSDD